MTAFFNSHQLNISPFITRGRKRIVKTIQNLKNLHPLYQQINADGLSVPLENTNSMIRWNPQQSKPSSLQTGNHFGGSLRGTYQPKAVGNCHWERLILAILLKFLSQSPKSCYTPVDLYLDLHIWRDSSQYLSRASLTPTIISMKPFPYQYLPPQSSRA